MNARFAEFRRRFQPPDVGGEMLDLAAVGEDGMVRRDGVAGEGEGVCGHQRQHQRIVC